MNDQELDLLHIQNIQENSDDRKIKESLDYLISRHSGIYIEMSKRYLPQNADFRMDQQDVKDEMPTFFWEAARDFDKDKGCKFSTYLGDQAKWKFLKSKRGEADITNIPDDEFWDKYTAPPAKNEEVTKEFINLALSKVDALDNDVVSKIFRLRYVECDGRKLMPWKEIGKRVGHTYEHCRQLHNNALLTIKELAKNEEFS